MNMDKNIPSEEEIVDLLNRIHPHPGPGFNQKRMSQPWNHQNRLQFWAGFIPGRTAASLGLILLLVLGISLLSPSLDTLAQRFSQFFLPSPSSQTIADTALLKTSHPLERFNLTISEAEGLAGFEMKTPAQTPSEFRLVGATYDELREAIILHHVTESGGLVLRISQQQLDSDYQGIGPETVVEMVEIGNHSGEFVTGGWLIPEVESGADATVASSAAQPVWDANVKLQTLRWADGEFLYEIIIAGSSEQSGYLDKDAMIALANRMQ